MAMKKQFTLSAPLMANTDDAKRFSALAYSGELVPDYGGMGDIVIDMATLTNAGASVPMLVDHKQWDLTAVAGHGTLILNNNQLFVEGTLSDATESGRMVAALMKEGFPVQLSVGITGDLVEQKAPTEFNGKLMNVRYSFMNATVQEVSFVSIPADANTWAQAHFSQQPQQENVMTRTPEDQALIDGLQAQVTELNGKLDTLQTQAQEQATLARKAAINALFSAVGKAEPEDLTPYLSMTDAAFAAYSADIKALQPKHDTALFTRTTPTPDYKAEPQEKGKALLRAVKQLAKV